MARTRSDIRPRILHAARERFLMQGVDGASLRAIARDAGTSIAMIYYYFPTKDDLFLAVVEEVYEVVLVDLTRALDPALPVEERVRRLYTRVGAVTDEEMTVLRLVLHESLVSSDRLDRLFERMRRGHLPHVLRTVGDGLADGTFDAGLHPLVILISMVALGGPGQFIRRVLDRRLPAGDAPGGEALSEQMLQVLLHGVGARSGESAGEEA